MKRKICILLTACVNPDGMAYTALQDPEERQRQYVEALDFYLKETNTPVVFVENTLTDFSSQYKSSIDSGRLEYLTFDGNNYDKKLGKGYGEAKLIMYAYEHSRILKECDYVVKITGRLIIRNIKNIIISKWFLLNNIFRCDFVRVGVLYSMLFVASPLCLYQMMRRNACNINDSRGVYFEHVLYNAITERNVLTIPFFKPVQIEGVSGTSNRKYMNRRPGENLIINLQSASRLCNLQHRYLLAFLYKSLMILPRSYFYIKKLFL